MFQIAFFICTCVALSNAQSETIKASDEPSTGDIACASTTVSCTINCNDATSCKNRNIVCPYDASNPEICDYCKIVCSEEGCNNVVINTTNCNTVDIMAKKLLSLKSGSKIYGPGLSDATDTTTYRNMTVITTTSDYPWLNADDTSFYSSQYAPNYIEFYLYDSDYFNGNWYGYGNSILKLNAPYYAWYEHLNMFMYDSSKLVIDLNGDDDEKDAHFNDGNVYLFDNSSCVITGIINADLSNNNFELNGDGTSLSIDFAGEYSIMNNSIIDGRNGKDLSIIISDDATMGSDNSIYCPENSNDGGIVKGCEISYLANGVSDGNSIYARRGWPTDLDFSVTSYQTTYSSGIADTIYCYDGYTTNCSILSQSNYDECGCDIPTRIPTTMPTFEPTELISTSDNGDAFGANDSNSFIEENLVIVIAVGAIAVLLLLVICWFSFGTMRDLNKKNDHNDQGGESSAHTQLQDPGAVQTSSIVSVRSTSSNVNTTNAIGDTLAMPTDFSLNNNNNNNNGIDHDENDEKQDVVVSPGGGNVNGGGVNNNMNKMNINNNNNNNNINQNQSQDFALIQLQNMAAQMQQLQNMQASLAAGLNVNINNGFNYNNMNNYNNNGYAHAGANMVPMQWASVPPAFAAGNIGGNNVGGNEDGEGNGNDNDNDDDVAAQLEAEGVAASSKKYNNDDNDDEENGGDNDDKKKKGGSLWQRNKRARERYRKRAEEKKNKNKKSETSATDASEMLYAPKGNPDAFATNGAQTLTPGAEGGNII